MRAASESVFIKQREEETGHGVQSMNEGGTRSSARTGLGSVSRWRLCSLLYAYAGMASFGCRWKSSFIKPFMFGSATTHPLLRPAK